MKRQIPEGRSLDYKRELPGRTDKDVKEFLADVSSFANASGGHLVFGVTTKKDEGQNTNLPDKIEGVGQINVEMEVLRLEQTIRDGIQPRLVTFHVKCLAEAGKPVLVVVEIPRSWNAPHVVGKMSPTFFSRTSTGKHPLDVTELRHAFAMSESVGERIRAFRDERIGRILAGETPVPIPFGAGIVLHLIPVSAFAERSLMDIKDVFDAAEHLLPIAESNSRGRRINLDGVYMLTPVGIAPIGYALLFRSGAIEIVDTQLLHSYERFGNIKTIPSRALEGGVIKAAGGALAALGQLGLGLPLTCFVSLLNVQDYYCSSNLGDVTHNIDRNHLLLPDILVESESPPADVFLRPAFDMIWQACGGRGCPCYTPDGRWENRG